MIKDTKAECFLQMTDELNSTQERTRRYTAGNATTHRNLWEATGYTKVIQLFRPITKSQSHKDIDSSYSCYQGLILKSQPLPKVDANWLRLFLFLTGKMLQTLRMIIYVKKLWG